jgi:hypothetical protein
MIASRWHDKLGVMIAGNTETWENVEGTALDWLGDTIDIWSYKTDLHWLIDVGIVMEFLCTLPPPSLSMC